MERDISAGKGALRVEKIAGYMTEVIELHSEVQSLQIVFIPGNPGVVPFYQTYLGALFQQFDGKASITAISHTAHTEKDWNNGQLFSLEEQIDHKIQFIKSRFSDLRVPLFLVGHSIGAYISLCVFKALPDKVQHVIGLYPFLSINTKSSYQSLLRWFSGKHMFRETLSHIAGFVGRLPECVSKKLLTMMIGHGCDPVSVDVAHRYMLQFPVVQNFTYMGMTEFKTLQRNPDWAFLKRRQDQISLLFGDDDHWGPLTLFEEVSMEIPALDAGIEKEGHLHAFCCTEAGSRWVATYSATVILKALSVCASISQT